MFGRVNKAEKDFYRQMGKQLKMKADEMVACRDSIQKQIDEEKEQETRKSEPEGSAKIARNLILREYKCGKCNSEFDHPNYISPNDGANKVACPFCGFGKNEKKKGEKK